MKNQKRPKEYFKDSSRLFDNNVLLSKGEKEGHGYYQFLTSGTNVCARCQKLHRKIFRYSEITEKEAIPPIHPNCRCEIVVLEGDINDIWDSVTITRIGTLHPAIQDSAIAFILAAQKQDINLRITDGFRSIEEQNILYEQGRTTPGAIVTNGRGGQSYHNFGLALDVVEMKDGVPLWEETDWDKVGALGKQFGFEWGGDWASFVDRPHFEMSFGFSTSQFLQMYNDDKTTDGFVNIQ
ncbi:MAG: M15 family metallopeptidase [Oscillospiraceae bacterium]|nr:M15 family metallopeptidase [Oscillospiraceae bacterium]